MHRRDDFGKHGFQSIGQNICDDFVDNVVQTDRSIVMDSMGARLFRDQSNVSVILFLQQDVIHEEIPNAAKDLRFNHRPIFLKEEGSEPIRAWGFSRT